MATENKQEPVQEARNASPDGEFIRDTNYIEDRIVPGISEPTEQEDGTFHWPQEAGRYRLAVARACPWAHRTVIARRLMGLEDTISLALAGPTHDVRSWQFDLDEGGVDPVLQIPRLQDAYFKRFPDYPRGITVPAIVEESTGRVVTNDYPSIVRDFITNWKDFQREGAPDLYRSEERRVGKECRSGGRATRWKGRRA